MVVVNACQYTLKSDFSPNMHFIRIGVLSLIESECGARLLLLVPGDSGLDK